jgi:hypothetical protein
MLDAFGLTRAHQTSSWEFYDFGWVDLRLQLGILQNPKGTERKLYIWICTPDSESHKEGHCKLLLYDNGT